MQRFDASHPAGPSDRPGPDHTGLGAAAAELPRIKDAYRWHRNEGAQVSLLLGDAVDMHAGSVGAREAFIERPGPGRRLPIEAGGARIACPLFEARARVVEGGEP